MLFTTCIKALRTTISYQTQYQRLAHTYKAKKTWKKPQKVLFFGSDDFSLPHLKVLHNMMKSSGDDRIIGRLDVVTSKRGPVQEFSKQQNLKIHEWPLSWNTPFDLGVVASFGHLIPEKLIQHFPLGMINIHPSLLPRFRGAAPLIHTILSGDAETGISVMKIAPHKFDVGPLLLQRRFSVDPETTGKELTELMAERGSKILLEVLQSMANGDVSAIPQTDDACAALTAPKVTSKHANVNWEHSSMEQIHRQYRALQHVHRLTSKWNEHHVRLINLVPTSQMEDIELEINRRLQNVEVELKPGQPLVLKKQNVLCVKCKDGWVAFSDIIIKNRQIPANSFFTGYLATTKKAMSLSNQDPSILLNFKSLENDLDHFALWIK